MVTTAVVVRFPEARFMVVSDNCIESLNGMLVSVM
jgi:hypothetical protein